MEVRGFEGRVEISPCLYEADKPYGAIRAIDRQALIDLLDKCVESQCQRGREITGFTITMPCGYERRFTTHCDIPFEDLPCLCGEEYLIKYKKE